MGGEGGGVFADWLVDLAEHHGHVAQSTSVPGVAQRTGATMYYVEILLHAGSNASPVMALMPLPGDVDVVIASELMEAARAVQRGLVTPERTVLVSSTHRVYAMAEKTALGDGRAQSAALLASASAAARRLIAFDMQRVAEEEGSVISAVLLGALAASEALPFGRDDYMETIRRGGIGGAASLRAFSAGYDQALRPPLPANASPPLHPPRPANASPPQHLPLPACSKEPALPAGTPEAMPVAAHPQVQALLDRAAREHHEAATRRVVVTGLRRLIDYQDPAWANDYLERLAALRASVAAARAPERQPEGELLIAEAARHLALWMSWEDAVRVAELKTRDSRFHRVRSEVRAGPGELLSIREYLHPRLQEVADTLPAALGRHLLKRGWLGRMVERIASRGRIVETTSLRGFLQLWALARLKRWRRGSLRFAVEEARIHAWLADVHAAAARRDLPLALEIVRCQQLVKGYGDTHARGWRSFEKLQIVWRQPGPRQHERVAALRAAALADEEGHALAQALGASGPQTHGGG